MRKRLRPEQSDFFEKYLTKKAGVDEPELLIDYEIIQEENRIMQEKIEKYKEEVNKFNQKVTSFINSARRVISYGKTKE